MTENNLNSKIKANATSAYFLVFLSLWFLFNKSNPNVNNDFVKSHTKSAFFVHILLFLNTLIFVIFIKNYYINTFLAPGLYLIIITIMFYWIYKANKWETLKIADIFRFTNASNLASLKQDKENSEKNKFELILSYIPFLSYIMYSQLKYNNTYNLIFKNNVKINIIASLIIIISYIFISKNLALILLLISIITVVFVWVILIVKDEFFYLLINPLNKSKNFEIYIKTFFSYIKNYKKWTFRKLKEIQVENIKNKMVKDLNDETYLRTLPDLKITPKLIYIPILNFIYFPFLNTKYRDHIINWISISVITIVLLIIYKWFDNIFILLLYPICFGYWNLKSKFAYKIPFIYHIFDSFIILKNKLKNLKENIKKTKAKVIESNFKINENISIKNEKENLQKVNPNEKTIQKVN